MPCRIIIETSAREDGGYRAQVADGPPWAKVYEAMDSGRDRAAAHLQKTLRNISPVTLDFLRADT